MRVLNSNFNFTVKVGAEHFGGHFSYHSNGAEMVKMSFRRLPRQQDKGYAVPRISHLKLMDGKWTLWDVQRQTPVRHTDDHAVYAVFREAFGLSLLDEAK